MRHFCFLFAASCSVLFAKLPELGPIPDAKPVSKEELTASITRGVDYLVKKQNPDGSFGSARRTKGLNIYAPVPEAHLAFLSGSSTLAIKGLIDSGDRRPEVLAAIDKGEKWMLTKLPKLRNVDPTTTYNIWGHAYGLRAIAALHKFRKGDEAKRSQLKLLASRQVESLLKIEDINGGWGYLDLDGFHTAHFSGLPTSFSTATALLGMKETQEELGIELPQKQIKRALASIEQQRTPDWAFVYSLSHKYRPRYSINRPAGSLGRSQVCMAAMRKFGDKRVTDELLSDWIHRLCVREGWFDIARKRPVPHETHFAISGYFYYYGFYYATECLQMLPSKRQQPFIPHLAEHL
ncbi:hypothetical protein N9A89_06435, partial [Akkermansiaceae bacterium]|nr:hypothetical protein [Akkermansiaceae bacterium]